MLKSYGRIVAKTGEKIVGTVGKIAVMTAGTRVRKAMKTVYAKERKMLVIETAQILIGKVIIEEPEAKIINVKDRLIEPDFFKVTEKVTTETIVQTAIAGDINK